VTPRVPEEGKLCANSRGLGPPIGVRYLPATVRTFHARKTNIPLGRGPGAPRVLQAQARVRVFRWKTRPPTAFNAVGGRVFQRKVRARARATCPRDTWRVRTPRRYAGSTAWEVRMDAGGPGPLWGVRGLGCQLGASLPQGHVASPDPSQSGVRVRGRWPNEVRA